MRKRIVKGLLGAVIVMLFSISSQAATVRGTPVTVTNDATQAVPVTGTVSISNTSTLYKPVGVTSQRINSTAGTDWSIYKLSIICSAQFTGSRLCTSEEIIKATNKITFTGNAIINPTIIAVVPTNGNLLDISGRAGGISEFYGGRALCYSSQDDDIKIACTGCDLVGAAIYCCAP